MDKVVWEAEGGSSVTPHSPAIHTYLFLNDEYAGLISNWGALSKGQYLALTAPSIGEVMAWFDKESDARNWLLASVLMERAIK